MLVECTHCEAVVDARNVASYDDASDENAPPSRFTLCACPRCNAPILIGQTDWGIGFEDQWRMFPPEDDAPSHHVPEVLRTAYMEARACHKAKAYTATAVMCRRTVEGLCLEHQVKAKSLAGALQELKDRGVIESRLYEWADALRLSGNEAAHDVRVRFSAEDAKDLLEFTNALLEYVYTFRERFSAFKQRRAGALAPAT